MKNLVLLLGLLLCFEASGQSQQRIDSLNNLPFETRISQSVKLIPMYLKNASDSKRIKYLKGEAESYSNLSLTYNYAGDFDLSTDYALRAIRLFEKSGNLSKVAFQYAELGYQMKRRDMKRAQSYMRKGLVLAERRRDTTSLLSIYNNYGVLKEMQQQLDSALLFYKKGLRIKEAIKDSTGLPFSWNNLAIVHTMKGEYPEAFILLNKAFEWRLRKKDSVGLAENYCYFGDYYAALNQPEKAIVNYEKSLEIARANRYAHLIMYNHEQLAQWFEKSGNDTEALRHFKGFEAIKDSVSGQQSKDKIAELELRFETEKKELQLTKSRNQLLEERETSRRKNLLLAGLAIITVFALVLGYFLVRQQRMRNQQLRQEHELRSAIAEIEAQNRLAEQRLSISRDLHDNIGSQLTFIISSLDNLKYAFGLAGSKLDDRLTDISRFTRETIGELRDTIWAMHAGELYFEDLVVRIRNFMEKARDSHPDVELEIHLDPELEHIGLDSETAMHVYRCLQEAVNNALKYASPKRLKLDFRTDAGVLVTITDDGLGFDPETVRPGHGLGNMEQRMSRCGGSVEITSVPDKGTRIVLQLPQTSIRTHANT